MREQREPSSKKRKKGVKRTDGRVFPGANRRKHEQTGRSPEVDDSGTSAPGRRATEMVGAATTVRNTNERKREKEEDERRKETEDWI